MKRRKERKQVHAFPKRWRDGKRRRIESDNTRETKARWVEDPLCLGATLDPLQAMMSKAGGAVREHSTGMEAYAKVDVPILQEDGD